MKTALENLIVVLKDENTISPYEMCSSGLVQALFTVLSNVSVSSTTLHFISFKGDDLLSIKLLEVKCSRSVSSLYADLLCFNLNECFCFYL